jgi:hypothetical protein
VVAFVVVAVILLLVAALFGYTKMQKTPKSSFAAANNGHYVANDFTNPLAVTADVSC